MKNVIIRKCQSFEKIFINPKPTCPSCLGDKLLIIATAPSAKYYFEYESVRKQFGDYDIMAVNFMLSESEEEMHKCKPKFIILLDDIFYSTEALEKVDPSIRRKVEKTLDAIGRIDWECYIITSVLADWNINNSYIHFIRLGCFKAEYNRITSLFFKKNYFNFGFNNVSLGALYFGITFGYKEVALLGCPYRELDFDMQPNGLHIHEHMHYYDECRVEELITYEELEKGDYNWLENMFIRGAMNAHGFRQLRIYANDKKSNVVNYSEGSQIITIKQGTLNRDVVGKL